MLTDSVGREFRQSTVEMTYLCFMTSGVSVERLKGWGLESSGSLCTHMSGGSCWVLAETLAGCSLSVWLGFSYSMATGFQRCVSEREPSRSFVLSMT